MAYLIHMGDCLDPETGLATLGDGAIDHVITDPPYEAEAHTSARLVARGGGVLCEEPLDFAPITEEVRREAALHFARVARRWSLMFCQAEAIALWRDAMQMGGASYRRSCVWIKPGAKPQYSGDRPGIGYESIVVCHAPGRSTWNGGGQLGVFTFTVPQHGRLHMTEKPLALMETLVRLFTDPGDTIVDPFMGSGTTGVAAVHLGRNFIGWEKDPRYFRVAQRRLARVREQLEIRAERPEPIQEELPL